MGLLKGKIDKLLCHDLIRPSKSLLLSPVVFRIKKEDKTLQLCTDFTNSEKVTDIDAYPLPSIETQVSKMSGCKFYIPRHSLGILTNPYGRL